MIGFLTEPGSNNDQNPYGLYLSIRFEDIPVFVSSASDQVSFWISPSGIRERSNQALPGDIAAGWLFPLVLLLR